LIASVAGISLPISDLNRVLFAIVLYLLKAAVARPQTAVPNMCLTPKYLMRFCKLWTIIAAKAEARAATPGGIRGRLFLFWFRGLDLLSA
jgi:hypothetical protein